MVSNESIIAASLLVLDKHTAVADRPIRPLIDDDFERIRQAKRKIANKWQVEKHLSDRDYAVMRSEMLDRWMKKHRWNIRTRNLYSSIIAKLTVWEQHTMSARDKQRLEELKPGAELYLQFLKFHQKQLV